MKRFILLFALVACLLLTVSCGSETPNSGAQEPPAPQHSHNHVLTSTEPPTCTDAGWHYYECECGDGYEEVLPALGGECTHESEIVTPATCLTDGLERLTCTRCGDTWERVLDTDPWNHDHGEWVITVPATEDSVGERVKTCKTCGEQDVVEIPVIPYTDGLRYLYDEEKNAYWVNGCDFLNTTTILVPPTYKGLPVIRITQFFEEVTPTSETVTEIVVPASVKEMDNCSFAYLPSLQTLTLPFVGHLADASWDQSLGWLFLEYRTENPEIPETLKTVTVTDQQILYASSFQYCAHLERVIFTDCLTEVKSAAFESCPALQEVIFPATVQTFWRVTFRDCPALTRLTIPFIGHTRAPEDEFQDGLAALFEEDKRPALTSVTLHDTDRVPNHAFAEFDALQEVILSDEITSIGYFSFYHCTSLRKLTLPARLTAIGEAAFVGSMLEHVTLPDALVSVGELAFAEMPALASVTFPQGATTLTLGFAAFQKSALSALTVPANVILGEETFADCDALLTVKLDTAVIAAGAFRSCDKLNTLLLGEGVTKIDEQAFEGCIALTQLDFAEKGTLQSIGAHAFAGCVALKNVTLPHSLSSLSYGVFYGCEGLESLSVPFVGTDRQNATARRFGWLFLKDGQSASRNDNYGIPTSLKAVAVTNAATITAYAFDGCPFQQILLAEGTQVLEEYALHNCHFLTDLRLPTTLTHLMENSIGSDAITALVIPDAMTYVAKGALKTPNLQVLTLPFLGETLSTSSWETKYLGHIFGAGSSHDQLQETGWNIPQALESVTLTKDTVLYSRAFAACHNLKHLILPDTLTQVMGTEVFFYCNSLEGTVYENAVYLATPTNPYFLLLKPVKKDVTACTLHADVRFIADAAFASCMQLAEITIKPKHTIEIPTKAFDGCIALTTVNMENVTSIGVSAFMNCTALKSIRLPDTLVSISTRSFENTGLRSITIPANVTSIARYAFTNTNLETAYFETEWDWMWADGWYEYGVTDATLDGDPYNAAYLLAKADYSILHHGILKKQ
ncbi:MAG: leucine-rich repeat domain-containing protein [Ruminococcaceae bacterium]|nr:leucine-rich repeat domain-containing protein [Oscillospiraceae bacterium]